MFSLDSMFWKEVTKKLNIKRDPTTVHHPQANGQMEMMNQVPETALRSYVNPELNNWNSYLEPFTLAYNSTSFCNRFHSSMSALQILSPNWDYPLAVVHTFLVYIHIHRRWRWGWECNGSGGNIHICITIKIDDRREGG